jgi:hypothetical protein
MKLEQKIMIKLGSRIIGIFNADSEDEVVDMIYDSYWQFGLTYEDVENLEIEKIFWQN